MAWSEFSIRISGVHFGNSSITLTGTKKWQFYKNKSIFSTEWNSLRQDKTKKIKKIKPNLLNFGTYIYYSKIYQNEN